MTPFFLRRKLSLRRSWIVHTKTTLPIEEGAAEQHFHKTEVHHFDRGHLSPRQILARFDSEFFILLGVWNPFFPAEGSGDFGELPNI